MQSRAGRISPAKLAHVVCLTKQLPEMRRWYMTVLNASVSIENNQLCFLRYDDEHHRIGLIRHEGASDQAPGPIVGVHHIAFTFGDLGELLGTFARLKEAGIEPFWCINHGATTSIYYRDPDANRIELQVDNFDVAACDEYLASGALDENPIGVIFDPEDWIRRYASGEPEESLTARPRLADGVSPFEQMRD